MTKPTYHSLLTWLQHVIVTAQPLSLVAAAVHSDGAAALKQAAPWHWLSNSAWLWTLLPACECG